MRQPNTDALHSVVNAALAAVAELQAEWLKLLPPDKLAQLENLIQNNVRIGVQIVNGAPPRVQFIGVDVRGGLVVLEEIRCTVAARH